MFEILFIFGVFGWLLGQFWEYLSALPAFPTLLTAFVVVPFLSYGDYLALMQRYALEGLRHHRNPVPPERFYWFLHRARLRRLLYWAPAVGGLAWTAALRWPADIAWTSTSIAGWCAGGAAILATARTIAAGVLYVRAAQWFDKMAPWAVGFYRRTLYRMSENPDFLGPDDVRREEVEKKTDR